MRILHVSEAFGGGLASAVQQYVRNSPEHEHELAYVFRPEAPISDGDLKHFASTSELTGSHLSRLAQLRTLLRERNYDVIHAHSAFGGVYARALPARLTGPIVYTPHCFAFNRGDYGRLIRQAFRAIESVLASRTSVFAACSPAEALQSRALHGSAAVVEVPNVAPPAVERAVMSGSRQLQILGAGRLNAQKDPLYFLKCVIELRRRVGFVRATWVGDGDATIKKRLRQFGVEVTGWVDRLAARELLSQQNALYLHTARWEGFPVSVLEAASASLPAFVRNGPAYDGMSLPLFFDSPSEFASKAAAYMELGELERDEVVRSQDSSLRGNSDSRQRDALKEVYSRAVETSRTASAGSRGPVA